MVEKFKRSIKEQSSEQYEGVAERGLRMLVFGKPGSGKVSREKTGRLVRGETQGLSLDCEAQACFAGSFDHESLC